MINQAIRISKKHSLLKNLKKRIKKWVQNTTISHENVTTIDTESLDRLLAEQPAESVSSDVQRSLKRKYKTSRIKNNNISFEIPSEFYRKKNKTTIIEHKAEFIQFIDNIVKDEKLLKKDVFQYVVERTGYSNHYLQNLYYNRISSKLQHTETVTYISVL